MSASPALTTFLSHTRDVVIECTPDVRITAWNRAAERVLGWTAREAIGQNGVHLLVRDPAYRARAEELMAALLPGRAVEDRIQLDDRDGRAHHLVVDIVHQGDSIVMIATDVSSQHDVEDRLSEAARLEHLPLIACGVSHDLNNLLAVVTTGIQLAQRELEKGHDPHAALEETLAAVLRASELNRRLATLARGNLPSRQVMSLTGVVRDTASFSLLGRGTTLDFRAEDALWPVEADPGQISQVVQNLVTNATEAMDGGGRVEVELANVTSPPATRERFLDGPHVVLRVADEGAGVPGELRRRIFDPFFSTKPRGSGLGLSTSASIVRAHHGFLRLESAEGRGSTFEVWLPAMPGAAVPPARPA